MYLVILWNSTYFSRYYYVQLSCSENVLSYSEETVDSVNITTVYS